MAAASRGSPSLWIYCPDFVDSHRLEGSCHIGCHPHPTRRQNSHYHAAEQGNQITGTCDLPIRDVCHAHLHLTSASVSPASFGALVCYRHPPVYRAHSFARINSWQGTSPVPFRDSPCEKKILIQLLFAPVRPASSAFLRRPSRFCYDLALPMSGQIRSHLPVPDLLQSFNLCR